MPLARIITHFAEDAAPLAERLRAQGYTVETVSPDHLPNTPAEVEIRIDECVLEEALVLAAEMAPEAAAVFVGEGVIIPETQPLDPAAPERGARHSSNIAGEASDIGEPIEEIPADFDESPDEKLGWLARWWTEHRDRRSGTEEQNDSRKFGPTFSDIVSEPAPPIEAPAAKAVERARLAEEAQQQRAREAELRRQAEAERVRLAEEASRIQREQEAERQRREAERERQRQEAEAERVRQEFEAVRLREQAETERLRRETEAAQARAAALQQLRERLRAEAAAAEAQRRAEEEAKAKAEAERLATIEAQQRAEREEQARRMAEAAAAEAQAGMQSPPPNRSRDVAGHVSTTPPVTGSARPDTPRPPAAVSRPPRSKTPTPKPRAGGRLRQREREWRVAIVVAAVFAVLLMLGWSLAGNPRPASPLSTSDLTKSSTIKQEVPFGPVTLPPPPATKPAAVAPPVPVQPAVKAKPLATKSKKTAKANHKSRRRSSRDASAEEEDVVVRHFDTPQPIAHPRNSQAELRRYSDQ